VLSLSEHLNNEAEESAHNKILSYLTIILVKIFRIPSRPNTARQEEPFKKLEEETCKQRDREIINVYIRSSLYVV
jgi:hypothetical protein